jgi:hypothetical protein
VFSIYIVADLSLAERKNFPYSVPTSGRRNEAMSVLQVKKDIIGKIGTFTSKSSKCGLKRSHLQLGDSRDVEEAIRSLVEEGKLQRVEASEVSDAYEYLYRLTDNGWESYDARG